MSKGFKWALGAVLTVFSIFGGVWALDSHFTPREIHSIVNAQQDKELRANIIQIQQQFMQLREDRKLEKARDNYWFWVREVENLRTDCAYDPHNTNKRLKLDRALKEKAKAEAYLKSLENK